MTGKDLIVELKAAESMVADGALIIGSLVLELMVKYGSVTVECIMRLQDHFPKAFQAAVEYEDQWDDFDF